MVLELFLNFEMFARIHHIEHFLVLQGLHKAIKHDQMEDE